MSETDTVLWELERVWTHRDSDRTRHHVEASDEQAAERRLERLEQAGETDDLGNEIESQAGNPLHVHVTRDDHAGGET